MTDKVICYPDIQRLWGICGPHPSMVIYSDGEAVEIPETFPQCDRCKALQEKTGEVEFCARYFIVGYVEGI